jgi:hypothetical protein
LAVTTLSAAAAATQFVIPEGEEKVSQEKEEEEWVCLPEVGLLLPERKEN